MNDKVNAVLEAIAGRQSLIKFLPERPGEEEIRTLLEAAVRAPNHHLNEPWRFIVMAGKAREQLGDAFAACARVHLPESAADKADAFVETERAKAFRSPVVIVVACIRREHPKAMWIEDLEATAAATQNLLIAANAMGLGAAWRTGNAAYDPDAKRMIGLAPEDDIVGFVYVGYPVPDRPALKARTHIDEVTRWEGWDAE